MRIHEMMSTDVACCTPDTPLEEVAGMMEDFDCGMIPVVAGDDTTRAVGVITDRDIAIRSFARGDNPLDLVANDIMTANPVCIHHDASHDEAMEMMEANQLRRILAIDGNGECVGVISQADIARNASAQEVAEVVQHVSQPSNAGSSPMMR